VAEGGGGAAAVREELPGLRGHGEHFTSVGTAHPEQFDASPSIRLKKYPKDDEHLYPSLLAAYEIHHVVL